MSRKISYGGSGSKSCLCKAVVSDFVEKRPEDRIGLWYLEAATQAH